MPNPILMRRAFIPVIASGGVAIPWYLSCGVVSADCIGAWQGINVASYVASKINLNNPAIHPLTDYSETHGNDGQAPLWSSYDGWNLWGGFIQDLFTDITNIETTWSMVCRFSECSGAGASIFGLANNTSLWAFPNYTGNIVRVYHGSVVNSAPGIASGVISISGTKSYRNGVFDKDLGNLSATINTAVMKIGEYQGARISDNTYTVKVQAFAMYNRMLTAAENLAIATALAAIPNGSPAYIHDGMILPSSIGR